MFSALILACFAASARREWRGQFFCCRFRALFMSVIYPTINSKGISCLPKSEHGAGAGVILFFTCLSAVLAPLAMGAVSDAMGGPKYGFVLATGFAALLFAGLRSTGCSIQQCACSGNLTKQSTAFPSNKE